MQLFFQEFAKDFSGGKSRKSLGGDPTKIY